MKDNIVFWGADEKDSRILVALRLRAAEKKVDIWTFEEKVCKKEFVDSMFGDWDKLDIASFPKEHVFLERDASSPELLPGHIKTATPENAELISRAEREWTVRVLSLRLYEMIKSEVLALKEQVMSLKAYDKGLWDSCKAYWDKIMSNHNDRNLNREQASELREVVNTSFERLKELMAETNKQYEEESQANFFQLTKKIDELNADFEKNPGKAKTIFNELRKLQGNMKDLRLNRSAYKDIRSKMNKSFEAVKKGMAKSNIGHFEKRINGLRGAIEKMQKSIDWDKGSIEFQNKRSNSVHAGQLEMQLRDAKIKMINARIDSKQAKLDDMQKTLTTLEKKLKKSVPSEKSTEQKTKAKAETANKESNPKEHKKKESNKTAEAAPKENEKGAQTDPKSSQPEKEKGAEQKVKEGKESTGEKPAPKEVKTDGVVEAPKTGTETKAVKKESADGANASNKLDATDTKPKETVTEKIVKKAPPLTTAEMTRRALKKNAEAQSNQEEE